MREKANFERVPRMRAYLHDSSKRWLLALIVALLPWPNLAMAAHSVTSLQAETPQELRSIAFRRHLENNNDAALDFYQRAIDKSNKEFGANSTYAGDLYFEMGLLAFSVSKFTTAEYCLTRAVQINPHAVVARLKLAELLRLREKPAAARAQIQQSVENNINSAEARQQLAVLLQETNPAAAAKQSFMVHQILTGVQLKPIVVKKASPSKADSPAPVKHTPSTTNEKFGSDKSPPTKPNSLVKPKEHHSRRATVEAAKASASAASKNKAKAPEKKQAPAKDQKPKAKANPAPAKHDQDAPQDILKEQKAQAAALAGPEENTQAKPAASKPAEKAPAEQKTTKPAPPTHKVAKKQPRDLVPPPPAIAVPVMLPPGGSHPDPLGQAIQLSTDAKLKNKKKTTKPAAEAKAETTKPAPAEKASSAPSKESAGGVPDDPDFLLKWASVEKKQKAQTKQAAPKDPN
jgi:tetratricopeptide (TPR) repeat protein